MPDPKDGNLLEGSFSLNLKPKARIGARLRLVIDEPGVYLLRVETFRTKSDHEHFAAIDLVIQ